MGRWIRWLALLLVVAGVAGLVWWKTRPGVLEVQVAAVVRQPVEKTVANTRAGTVEACRRARLSPSLGGQIARLPIHEGDQVKAGQLLLEIWNDDLKAQQTLADREVGVAEAQANSACLSSEEAARVAARAMQLFHDRVGSEEVTDQSVTRALALEAECEAAKATVKMALARLDLARANLERTRLTAPFAGVVARIEGELSEYVTPSPVGVQTPPAVDLIENSCYYISAPIDEVDAAGVKVGMVTRITLDAYRGRTFAGTVRRIAPYVLDVEKQARTVDIEAAFESTDDFALLLAGYSADVEIVLDRRDDTLSIPTEAVMEGGKVYVYDQASGRVTLRSFTAGLANWATTEVLSGLAEGEEVVVNVDKAGLGDGVAAVRAEASP